jgi:hypothetical protein
MVCTQAYSPEGQGAMRCVKAGISRWRTAPSTGIASLGRTKDAAEREQTPKGSKSAPEGEAQPEG